MNKHPVSLLQEKMAQSHKALPTYTIEHASFSTGNKFICTVKVDGITAIGTGSNKQNAKSDAAMKALEKLTNTSLVNMFVTSCSNTFKSPPQVVTNSNGGTDTNFIGQLNELASQNRLPTPTYSECGVNEKNEFVIGCTLLDNVSRGFAPTKKQAKQRAAKEMLAILDNVSIKSLKEKVLDINLSNQKPFKSDEEICELFKVLSTDNKFKEEQDVLSLDNEFEDWQNKIDRLSSEDYISSISPDTTFTEQSTTDLRNELHKFVSKIDIQVIQERPYCVLVLSWECRGKKYIIEMGETYEDSLRNVLKKSLLFVNSL